MLQIYNNPQHFVFYSNLIKKYLAAWRLQPAGKTAAAMLNLLISQKHVQRFRARFLRPLQKRLGHDLRVAASAFGASVN